MSGKLQIKNSHSESTKDMKSNFSQTTGKSWITKPEKTRGNIWNYSTGWCHSSKDAIAFQHPAIFPEKLVADHILSWSNEGDLVLDPFCGSGTTLKVAMQLNRNAIGIEASQEYCQIIRQRIEQSKDLLTK